MRRPARLAAGLAVFLYFMWAIGYAVDHEAKAHGVSVWIRMADCETGDGDGRYPYRAVWDYNGRSGFDGGLQFSPATWNRAKRLSEVRAFAAKYAYAHHAPAYIQIRVADNWRRHTSWAQWPACSRKLGLR